MNVLSLTYPDNSNISISINSGVPSQTVWISGTTGTLNHYNNYRSCPPSGVGILTTNLVIPSGTGSYTGNVYLSSLNTFNGAEQKFLVQMPGSINPVIQFKDAATHAVLLTQSGQPAPFPFFAEFSYQDGWALDFWV